MNLQNKSLSSEFELKFGFEPGSVRFKKILKFAEPRTEIKVRFGPLPEL